MKGELTFHPDLGIWPDSAVLLKKLIRGQLHYENELLLGQAYKITFHLIEYGYMERMAFSSHEKFIISKFFPEAPSSALVLSIFI